jgi:N-acetylglutamate synthase-like GNAT family acetyltransferase
VSALIRPSTAADFVALVGKAPPTRVRAVTVVDGETLLGIGGLLIHPNGDVWASMVVAPEARRYPVSMHRGGLRLMQIAREAGFSRVFATADDGPRSVAWLERLGFEHSQGGVFVWSPAR